MLRRLRETGPVVLVPLAWAFTAAAHLGLPEFRTVLIAHVVMDVLLFAFAALSWSDMTDHPVLRAWLGVVVTGLGVTLVGTYALATGGEPTLVRVTVLGWMAVPTVALVYTGVELPDDEWPLVYATGGALSAAGAVVFLAGTLALASSDVVLAAIALAGVGQTAGIVAAVLRY